MEHIVLSEQQLSVVAHTKAPVAVHDESGKLRGYIAVVITEAELNAAKRALASKGPRYSTEEVLAKLRSLEAT
jgi:hypothetical protein